MMKLRHSTIDEWVGKGWDVNDVCGTCLSEQYKDPEWLRDRYIVCGWGIKRIAKLCGVSAKTITYHLLKNGIPTRGWQPPHSPDKHYKDPEWLRLMVSEGYSLSAIGKLAGCSPKTLVIYLWRFGIERTPAVRVRKNNQSRRLERKMPSAVRDTR